MRSQRIKQHALHLGFDDCGIAPADALKAEEIFLTNWLQNSYHANMNYMARNQEKRVDVRKMMEGAKSVICLLSNYKPAQWQEAQYPQIAAFAYGEDYHVVLKERLHRLAAYINDLLTSESDQTPHPQWMFKKSSKSQNPEVERHRSKEVCEDPRYRKSVKTCNFLNIRMFVDTAPILERAWAARAGLGWIGKSSLLVSPRFGPFTFIAIILTNFELEYDRPVAARCDSCTRCLNACPTGALCAPYTVDARLCISYHTIENRDPCRVDPQPYLFGCDSCLRVCPWGESAPSTTLFPPLPDTLQLTAKDWKTLSNNDFNRRFAKSPVQRAGLTKLQNTLELWNGKQK